MNKITIIGNVTNEPEKRATQSGKSMCLFTVAVNRKFPAADGNKITDFFRVATWNGLADVCGKYVAKGTKIAVVGELQAKTYEGKDGKTRMSLEISADEVEFLSQKEKPQEKPATNEWQDISSDDLPWRV